MKQIYIPSLNIIILFFFKSGSSLYTAFIENMLRYMKLEYDYSEITVVRKLKPKVYLMVRNPLERVFTSFYWTKTFDIHSQEDKFPIEQFSKFIDGLEDEVNSSLDNHLLPQTWNLVKGITREDDQYHELTYKEFSNFNFNSNFFKDLDIKIIQLENFQHNFTALKGVANGMMFYPFFQKFDSTLVENIYFKKSIGQLAEIVDLMNPYEKLYSIFLYNFIETSFKMGSHHNNLSLSMLEKIRQDKKTFDTILKANEFINNESLYFGYDNKRYLNKHHFGVI